MPRALQVFAVLTIVATLSLIIGVGTAAEIDGQDLKGPFNGQIRHPRSLPADFQHIRIELTFDWEKESLEGKVTHRFKSVKDGMKSLTLDAVNMTFDTVTDGNRKPLEHRGFDDRIEIDLARPLDRGQEATVVIAYGCKPEQGIYFVSPIGEYPERRRQVWAQGEMHESQHYYPCFDFPSDRVTSEVIVTIPEGLRALSNGILVSDRRNGDGTHTVHWSQEKTHVNYLITLAVGDYETIDGSWDGIPLSFWHEPGDAERAQRSFARTDDMMAFFSKCFGRYPWAKYDQIVVRDFHFGGMENTTATVLTERTLHEAEDQPHTSSRGLVAHELAHQWFGDLVTCRDWAHIWLNESFATFCDALWTEEALGRPDAQIQRLGAKESYQDEDRNQYRRPLCCRTYRDPRDMFDRHSYPKGSLIIGMLRQHLGEETFYRAARDYLDRHEFGVVETAQFQRAVEDSVGESLGWFFEQWVYRGGHPEIEVRQRYDAEAGKLTLTVKQAHPIDRVTPLYRLPVEVGLFFAGGDSSHESITVTRREETFSFDCHRRPEFVRFDRRSVLLMNVDFEKSRGEWIAQLTRDSDTLGRVFAARALGTILQSTDDAQVRQALERRLVAESFWGVRRAIAKALAHGGGADAARALEDRLAKDADVRVREQCAISLGIHRRTDSFEALEKAFRGQRSDWVRAACLRALHDINADKSWDLTIEALALSSHRERIRNAAIEILEKLRRPEGHAHLIAAAQVGQPRQSRIRAIEALGLLGRGNEPMINTLLAQVDDPHRYTRTKVVEALSKVGGDLARRGLEERQRRETRKEMREKISEALATMDAPETIDQIAEELKDLRKKNLSLERRLNEIESKEKAPRASF